MHKFEKADLELAETVAIEKRSRAGRALARFAELGDQPPLITLGACVLAAGLAGGNRKLVRTGLRMLAAHAVATAAKGFIKDRVDRTRPGVALGKSPYKLEKGRSRDGRLRSMPSGHSAGLAAVARAVAREYPDLALPAGAAAASVAAAQLPSGNHFATDIAAGTAIGIASEAAVAALMGPDKA
ncbi:phosphatase PAP2 family protein [Sphingomonas mesophila]|uniref:phosphatase PAP2 family protein n=1 Tax=Sphingomonas mesophila TaxID=2303576 RepID=UPI0013C34C59|nr:phosphatase PAP2 family protein [Sphingomonas mesophila]